MNSFLRLLVFLFLASAAPVAWSQAAGQDDRSAADVIGDCGESAPEESVGLTALEEACPGLTGVLEESGYLPFLSTDLREKLQFYDLTELQQVQSWYAEPTARSVELDTLGPILDSLRQQQAERPLTWFERLRKWLRAALERQQSNSDSWLSRWLDGIRISDAVSRAILLGSVVLVIGLALGVIINELRVAGLLRRRRARAADAAARTFDLARTDASVDLDAVAREDRAPALLHMLVSTLVRSGRLRTERSLTHRELCTHATFDDVQQRDCFQRVAKLAERTVYGGGEVPPEEIEPIVAAARALNAQLGGAAA